MPTNVLGSAVVQIDVKVNGLDQISALHGALGRIAAARGVVQKLSAIGIAANQMGQQIRQLSFTLRDAGRQFLLFSGVIGGALLGIAKVTASFEQSIANTKAVINELAEGTPAAEGKLNKLSQTILDVAAASKFTATEVAAAAEQLGLSGFKADEVIRALKGTIDLAAAGATDLSTAAMIAANAVRAWALDASHASRVADVLAVAATNSNTTITTLGESLKLVAATASVFGISLEETTTALALLGDAGLRGSIAGTSLNRLLIQLGSNTKKLADFLAEVGVSADEVDPLKHSLEDIVAVFRDLLATGKASATSLAAAFDQRAVRALLVLTKTGAERFEEMADKIKSAAGEAEKIANIKLDTVEGAFLLLKSAIEAVVVAIGQTFQEELKNLIRDTTRYVKEQLEWIKANKELVKSWVDWAVQALKVSAILAVVFLTLGRIAAIISSITILTGFLATAFSLLASVISTVTTAVGLLSIVLGVSTGGIYFVVAAVGALVLALGGLVTWLISTGDEAEVTQENMDKLLDTAGKLTREMDGFSSSLARQISAQERLNEILGKGSDITEKELKEIPELLLNGASFDADKLEADIVDAEKQVSDFIDERNKLVAEGEKFVSKEARDAVRERVRILDAEIDRHESLLNRLVQDYEQFRKVDLRGAFKEFQSAGGGTNEEFKQSLREKVRLAEEASKKLQLDIRSGDRRADEDVALQELELIRKQIDEYRSQLNLTEVLFTPETLDAFLDSIRMGYNAGQNLKESLDVKTSTQSLLEYNEELKKTQEEAIRVREALDKDVENFLDKGVENKFQEAQQLRDRLSADTNNFIARAMEISSNNLALLGNDFTKNAEAIAKENQRLQNELDDAADKFLAQRKAIDAKEKELIDEQITKQNVSLRDAQKKKAEADKDIKTLEKIIREERKEQLQKEIEDKGFEFDPAANADAQTLADTTKKRAEFEKLFNEETERDIQNRKDQIAAEEEREKKAAESKKKTTKATKERLDTEKDITSELIKQVKTFEDAARAVAFARNLQKQRERDAKTALRDQAHAEVKLLELQERRNELAKKGQDTTRLDRQLSINRRLLGLSQGFVDKAAEEAGGTAQKDISPTLKQFDQIEIDSKQLLEDAKARLAAFRVALDLFEGVTEQFKLAPQGWVQALIDSWNQSIQGFNPQLPAPQDGNQKNAPPAIDANGNPIPPVAGDLPLPDSAGIAANEPKWTKEKWRRYRGQPELPATVPGLRGPGVPLPFSEAHGIAVQNNNDNRNINIEINGANANPTEIADKVMEALTRNQFV